MKLTKPQQRILDEVKRTGFVERKTGFGRSQSNGPAERLVAMGLLTTGWGPRGSFLMTQGYLLPL
jgi:hypothetical protein